MKTEEDILIIALKELRKGKTPEEIEDLAIKAQIPVHVIRRSFIDIHRLYPIEKFRKSLEKYRFSTITNPNSLWEKVISIPQQETLERRKLQVEEIYKMLKKRPWMPNAILAFLFINLAFGVIFFGLTENAASFRSDLFLVFEKGEGLILYPAMLYLIFLAVLIHMYVMLYQNRKHMVKLIIAENNSWFYDPYQHRGVWQYLSTYFWEIFRKGNKNRNIQEQFWGKVQGVPFWSGIFHYEDVIQYGEDIALKDSTNDHFFALKLEKPVEDKLYLTPKGNVLRLLDLNKKSKAKTESIHFNRYFDLTYKEREKDAKMQLIKKLNPSIIVRLAELAEAFGPYTVLIKKDIAFFYFKGRLLPKSHLTNIVQNLKVTKKDQDYLEHKMNRILDITSSLTPFLR